MNKFRLVILIVLETFFFSKLAWAEDIRICSGQAAYQNIFDPIASEIKSRFGFIIVPALDPIKTNAVEGLKGLLNKTCDALAAPSDIDELIKTAKEKEIFIKREQITHRVIGRDRLIVVFHPQMKIEKLSMKQLSDIFSGKIKNWKELGGPDQVLRIVIPTGKPTTVKIFQKQVLKQGDYAANLVKVENYDDIVVQINKDPGGIGFMSEKTPHGNLVVAKTNEDLGRPIILVTLGRPSEKVFKLIQFISDHKN